MPRSTALAKPNHEAIREKYKRAENRTRRAMVATFLLHGQSIEKMSKILDIPEAEVRANYDDALEEIQQEMASIPEGPLHVSEVVVEGYSRLVQRILANCEEAQQRLAMSTFVDPKAEMAMVAWSRLSLEAFDALTERMEKYGHLPMVPKSGLSHGGVRPGKIELKDSFDTVIREYAKEHGLNLDEETQKVIDQSVGR